MAGCVGRGGCQPRGRKFDSCNKLEFKFVSFGSSDSYSVVLVMLWWVSAHRSVGGYLTTSLSRDSVSMRFIRPYGVSVHVIPFPWPHGLFVTPNKNSAMVFEISCIHATNSSLHSDSLQNYAAICPKACIFMPSPKIPVTSEKNYGDLC